MALFRDAQNWRLAAKDILYRDPFSEATHRLRKKIVFVSVLVVLNSYFPLDLSQSTALGLKFKDGIAPSLSGILCISLVMMALVWVVYSIQELTAWRSQAKESQFLDFTSKLDKLSARDKDIVQVVEKGLEQLTEHRIALEKIKSEASNPDSTHEERVKAADDESVRMENWLRSIGEYAKAYESRVAEAAVIYSQIATELRAVALAQSTRVGLVEVLVPLALVLWAVFTSSSEAAELIRGVLH